MESDIADDSLPGRSGNLNLIVSKITVSNCQKHPLDWADEVSEEESPRKKVDTGYYRIPRYSAEEMQARQKAESDAVELARARYAKKLVDDNWSEFLVNK
jgi:hypothetical protein